MSYDLYLFEPPPIGDVAAALEQVLEARGEDGYTGPRDPATEAWKEEAASMLRGVDSELTPFEFDYAEVARHLQVSEAEARAQWRHIELNGPDERGLQVTIEDGFVVVTLAFWHTGDLARAAFRMIAAYAGVLCSRKALVLYDPQLARVIDLDVEQDMSDAIAAYEGVVARIPAMLGASQPGSGGGTGSDA